MQKELAFRLKLADHLRQDIRNAFKAKDYLEVNTPILTACPGMETHLRYFSTEYQKSPELPTNPQNPAMTLHLRSSPEIQMKSVLSEKLPRIFQIGPCFRNGGEYGQWHNPEFTMLEWYDIRSTFEDLIAFTADIVNTAAQASLDLQHSFFKSGSTAPEDSVAQGIVASKFKYSMYSCQKLFETFAGIEKREYLEKLNSCHADPRFSNIREADSFETRFHKILIDVIEPQLRGLPLVCICDFPPEMSALSVVEKDKFGDAVAKRFEFYIYGIEICNGYKEQFDFEKLEALHKRIRDSRQAMGLETPSYESAFISQMQKLSKSLLPIGHTYPVGNALGLSRLEKLLTSSTEKLDADAYENTVLEDFFNYYA